MKHPVIIQGGMGVAVSNWQLARTVSEVGQLGVVSGTGMNTVLVRRLQDGDPDGHMRRALAHFPFPGVAERILERYFIAGGKPADQSYKLAPMYTLQPNQALQELTVAANFAEVWLAKAGHNGVVGINLLEKVQLPNLASLYGAMLADVDYVLMGAGIPREIPGALDALARQEPARLKLYVEGAGSDDSSWIVFDPQAVFGPELPAVRRPDFLAIIASNTLALALAKKATGPVNGFIIEAPTAGGHNAPPRGPARRNERNEPLYGPRDEVNLEQIKALGLPFWLAGGCADAQRVEEALAAGAAGVQIGTAFALSDESGISAALKQRTIAAALSQTLDIRTDAEASPTGFPFKVAQMEHTIALADEYAARERCCDLGYLRTAYRREDGKLGYRCASEPIDAYVKKGGTVEDTCGRKCLCNGLMATVGMGQHRDGYDEAPLVTMGDDVASVARFIAPGATSYSARDVINALLPQPVLA